MRKPRFSIRTLLIASFCFALLLAAWINPPSDCIHVRLERGGNLTVNGDEVSMANLQSCLTWKHRWLSIWHRKPNAYVVFSGAHIGGRKEDMMNVLLSRVKNAGFASPTIDIYDVEEYFPGATRQKELARQRELERLDDLDRKTTGQ